MNSRETKRFNTSVLKRFVSLEFNRFLDYYKDAEDLNYHEKGMNSDRGERGMKEERGARGEKGGKRGNKIRFKMNIGNKDGINPSRLLGIINDIVGDKTISVGDIEVTNKFTFFDIFEDQSDKIINAFAGQTDIELGVARESKGYSERDGGGDRKSQGGRWKSDSGRRRSEGGDRNYGDRDRKKSGDRDRRPGSDSWRSENNDKKHSGSERKTDKNKRPSGKQSDKPWRNRR